ncbi:MAG: bifunctional tRNA (5-methylaminomethyl-2-thiouridine)(34)-methyltransferase MnmD/FAD-dependent 5-carboxymethylaminomethyl-2-thiouridine(34) oxidoreductase MnmC [Betaproteobacteria bacterium PRO3]|nr:bifunctional tRNA (5-methylaminomethyl-2-thiouridine)(34)-methyltransferase MnmD/FAD-dependent 5-carboxymethylaminomethyl-2-thiouridine(34) oxidoreductase MnmC [Betaproteobacteria bacterium PRO3]
MSRLEPAIVTCAPDGTPLSERYGDVYHSADSGPGQARHVFLGGNGLPGRWRGRDAFVVLETGFGLGLNFLATWDAWRRDGSRPGRLDYIAIEKHPLARDDLATVLARYPEFGDLARRLAERWPSPLPGTHRRDFGGVVLTVVFDDIASALARLSAAADAVYLDGFAPARNPDMWTPAVLRTVARRMRTGATCATWSTARAVRDALSEAGVACELRPGFGHKREMLAGTLVRSARSRHPATRTREPYPEQHAIIVGAGLAGASAAASLAARGWRTTIIEAASAPATGASSLWAGSVHPLIARDDSRLARLSRAAFLHALDAWREREREGHTAAWRRCGVLQLARRPGNESGWRAAIESLGFPPEFVRLVEQPEACALSGIEVGRPGLWFPEGGYACAPRVVRAWLDAALAHPGSRLVASTRVERIERAHDLWNAIDASGATIAAAPVVVLANANDLARMSPVALPLRSVRGQVTYVPSDDRPAPRSVVIGNGYVLPPVDGRIVTGSSYDLESAEPAPTVEAHAGNLARLGELAPALAAGLDPRTLDGGVGFRAVASDRMPIVGALGDPANTDQPPGRYAIGAFASRGLTWAALMGEFLASTIEGDPLPIESDLAEAIDPGRFVRRARRRAGGQ